MSWVIFGGMMFFALGVIGLDISIRKKKLDTITAVYFGLIVGLFMTYVLNLALVPVLAIQTVLETNSHDPHAVAAGACGVLHLHQFVDANQE